MRGLARRIRGRLSLRGWFLVGSVLGLLLLTPWVFRSRFVTDHRAERSFRSANAQLDARDFPAARQNFRAGLALRPDAAGPRAQLAALELSLGDWELAFLEFQTLTEMAPEVPDGWIGLADLMVKSGLLSVPEAALDNGLAADPRRADAHRIRGDLRFRMGRYHGALRDAEAALAGAPGDRGSWELLVRSTARSRGANAGVEAARRGIAAIGSEPLLVQPLAWLLAKQGHPAEAVTLLQEAIRTHPDSTAPLTLARIELRAGEPDAARKTLVAFLAKHPADEETLALEVIIDAAGGRVDVSLQQLGDALQILPRSRLLGELRSSLQQTAEDRAAVTALVSETLERELGPAPASAARVRAEAAMSSADPASLGREHWPGRLAQGRQMLEAQLRQQDWVGAQRLVGSALQRYPGTLFAPFLAGIFELARGQPKKAEERLSESLVASPRSPVVAAALAKTWSRQKGAGFAGDQLLRLADRDPGFTFARYLAAHAYMDNRDPQRAETALRRGLDGKDGSAAQFGYLTTLLVELDRRPDAVTICQEGRTRFPQDLPLRMAQARLETELGKSAEAIRLYDDLLSQRPDLDLVEYKLAGLLASQPKETASASRSAQVLDDLRGDRPSDPVLLDALGSLHASVGETARARELLEAAARAAPDDPRTRFHLGSLYARTGHAELARSELKAAIDSEKPFPERVDALRLLRDGAAPPAPSGEQVSRPPP